MFPGDQIMEDLLNKKNQLVRIVDILDGMTPDVEQECLALKKELEAVNSMLAKRREILQKAKDGYQKQLEVLKKLEMTEQYLDYIEKNRPTVLKREIKVENNVNSVTARNHNENDNKNKIKEETEQKIKTNHIEVNPEPPHITLNGSPVLEEWLSPKFDTGKVTQNFVASNRQNEFSINYITEELLNSLSNYMRGRITLEDVNGFVDLYNSVLKKKYTLLKKPKSSVKTKRDLEQCTEWRAQEIPDTKGKHFCTAADIWNLANKKLGSKENNIIIILRHVKRIKEVRNKKTYLFNCM